MMRYVLPTVLLLCAPIGLASAQPAQRAARAESAQPIRAATTLPVSIHVPAGADSAKALNTYLAKHPKRKDAAGVHNKGKMGRASTPAASPSRDSSAIVPLPIVRPSVKPVSPPPSLR